MARRRSEPETYEDGRCGMFSIMREKIAHSNVDTEVGIPVVGLPLRWLMSAVYFPLGKLMQINGPEGSCKSSLATEFIRLHMMAGGGGVVAENEYKDYEPLRKGIWLYNPDWLQFYDKQQTTYIEEWQEYLTRSMRLSRDYQLAAGGPGKTIPLCWLVDSVMGTPPLAEVNKIMKDGYATIGYAVGAQLISRYLRAVPTMVKGFPFTSIYTNHAQPGMPTPGAMPWMPVPTVTPGGKRLGFMETFEFEMERVADIDKLEYSGVRLRIRAKKNSFGDSRKKALVDFLWWDVGTGEERKRLFAWDWHTASIDLILSFENIEGKKTLYNNLQDVLHIGVKSKGARKGWSDALGVPRSSPASFRTLGYKLERSPELLDQVYEILGIYKNKVFEPGLAARDRANWDELRSPMSYLFNDEMAPEDNAESGEAPEG